MKRIVLRTPLLGSVAMSYAARTDIVRIDDRGDTISASLISDIPNQASITTGSGTTIPQRAASSNGILWNASME
jgi:hypothetical protein